MSVMIYKHGGPHKIHGDNFDYLIVDEGEVESKLSEGWYLTTTEAFDNKKPKRGRPPVEKTDETLGDNNVLDKERDS